MKQIRNFNNSTILAVTSNLDLSNSLKDEFASAKQFTSVDNIIEALNLCEENKFDILIINANGEDLHNMLDELTENKNLSMKFIISDQNSNDDLAYSIYHDISGFFIMPIDAQNIKTSIIDAINRTKRADKVDLGEGFYYDLYRDRIYNKAGEPIDLTKLEFQLLKLLIEKSGTLVTYDMIHDHVWKNKKMSIFTMRNVVNKIRTKTYYGIFANASSQGYILG